MKLPKTYTILHTDTSAAGGIIDDVSFKHDVCPLTKGCPSLEVDVVAAASIMGGLYGGPEPKYYHKAAPGEILHVHQVTCDVCGKRQDYSGDGVHTVS